METVHKPGLMHLGKPKPVGESFSILLLCDTFTCQHVRLHPLTSSALIAKVSKVANDIVFFSISISICFYRRPREMRLSETGNVTKWLP